LTSLALGSSSPQKLDFLGPSWRPLLCQEFSLNYMEKLRQLLRADLQQGYSIYPPKDKIFRVFQLLDFDEVRVVLLGQDPYHGSGQANGLAFAVEQGVPLPPSLENIFKEIQSDIGQRPENTHLENWVRQGVFLLNTVLTVRANSAFSHRNKGWEIFTDRVISILNEKETPLVFLLWGAAAQTKAQLITAKHHKILRCAHPSPLSAHRGFLGCRHFSKTNAILQSFHLPKINWTI
jgi:uracil-DNA glycosylase